MLHVLVILVITGVHTHAAQLVAGLGHRPWRDVELDVEMRIVGLVEGTERNEEVASHSINEALVTMEHLAHTVGG